MMESEKVSIYLEFCEKHKNVLSTFYLGESKSMGICRINSCFRKAKYFGNLHLKVGEK